MLDDLLEDWQMHYKPDFEGLRLIGYPFSPQTHDLKDFLAGNLFPYEWLDAKTSEKAADLMRLHGIKPADLPAVLFEDGTLLSHPGKTQLAEKLGLQVRASHEIYDVVIVGPAPVRASKTTSASPPA